MSQFLKRSWFLTAAFFCSSALAADLTFQPLTVLSNKAGTKISLTLPSGTFARVDASTNLLDWNGFVTAGVGFTSSTDLFSGSLTRYYRAASVTNAGTFAGDHIPTDSGGDVIVRPVRHAGFIMSWNGVIIANDPYQVSYASYPKAHIVLISHHHGDHFDPTALTGAKTNNAVIIATQSVFSSMSTTLRASTTVLINGASTNILGVEILSVPAYDFDGQHDQGVCNGYVVTLGGKRFYMAGDTDSTPEMRALTDIDVAFLPMNSFTMTSQTAANAAKAFMPKIVYPYHYTDLVNATTFRNLLTDTPAIEVRLRNWY